MSVANASSETTCVTMSRLRPGCNCTSICANGSSRAPNALGHRADQPVVAGEHGDDPVGFAELVLAQHHRTVSVQPHGYQFVTALRLPPHARADKVDTNEGRR